MKHIYSLQYCFFMVFMALSIGAFGQNADLKLTAFLSPDTTLISLTDTLTVRFEVLNNGNANATGVVVSVNIPSIFNIVSTNALHGSYASGAWTLPLVASSEPNPRVLEIKMVKPVSGISTVMAEITQMSGGGTDPDSTPGNGANTEDDYQSFCISTPFQIAEPQGVTVEVAQGTTGVQWYKDAAPIPGATGMTYRATESGVYSFTSSQGGCPNGNCCPVEIIASRPPCPTPNCVTATVRKN